MFIVYVWIFLWFIYFISWITISIVPIFLPLHFVMPQRSTGILAIYSSQSSEVSEVWILFCNINIWTSSTVYMFRIEANKYILSPNFAMSCCSCQ